MQIENIQVDLIYQLVFIILLLALTLVFFVILTRYTGWIKIHLDRVEELYKIDNKAIDTSFYSLSVIAQSKGMELPDDEDDKKDDNKKLSRGKYKEFTDI